MQCHHLSFASYHFITSTILSSSAENLRFVDLPVSEAEFDISFPNMLVKRFLGPENLKIDLYVLAQRIIYFFYTVYSLSSPHAQFVSGEIACWTSVEQRNVGRSRARIGQECGFPKAYRKKTFEDHIDLV